jgi:hypothetical protein
MDSWRIFQSDICVARLERLSVTYKSLKDLTSRDGTHHEVSKKEFARLTKSGSLLTSEETRALGKPMSRPSTCIEPDRTDSVT